ncbi:MAG: class I SAM-dependent methyltransferase [Bacteriovoracaceae bacterium]|nr:class I SAM-dependent methyltransferase [Bacteriovoracaceae bacterium]
MIKNRLKKNLKRRKPWLNEKIEAFRLYDRDIPEYPFIVEIFKEHSVVWKKTDIIIDKEKSHHFDELIEAIQDVMGIEKEKIHIKERTKKSGQDQYEKLAKTQSTFPVKEYELEYLVNLEDYLDTGLFLDHRPLRQEIQKMNGTGRMLNLFCYTGSVSVAAAKAGFQTYSIDLSKTYLEWARENLKLNDFDREDHILLNTDVLEWLEKEKDMVPFDLIFFDPPTFSNSKSMKRTFEVEKDHLWMIDKCMELLSKDGVLYFSNNKRKFKLDNILLEKYLIKDKSEKSIPQDFHDRKIHNLFEVRHRND